MRRGIASKAKRLVGVGLGAGFCVVLGALPAGAVTLGPVTLPTLPPLEVAPGPVTVGPVTVDANASVTPEGAQVGVATSGLPVPDGGPDLGVSVGTDGAQVGVGGVDAGVVLSPPPAIGPGTPASSGGDGSASTPVVAAPRSSSGPAGRASSSASSAERQPGACSDTGSAEGGGVVEWFAGRGDGWSRRAPAAQLVVPRNRCRAQLVPLDRPAARGARHSQSRRRGAARSARSQCGTQRLTAHAVSCAPRARARDAARGTQ